ncbi:MAG: hypothetical protein C0409_02625 [Novosphingobium sp.]|nr:hypothetical protein [Novosphingobium sp.]
MGTRRLDRINDYGRAGYRLRVFCMSCGNVVVLDPADVLARCRTHQARSIEAIEQRMKCGQCGARNAACGPVERT